MSTTRQRSRTPHGAAYLESGAGAALLLIHGVGMRLEAWGPQIDALCHGHRVIAVDMPGHGESEPLSAGSRLPDFVAWFATVLDDLGLDAVNVAGHSMGALIAGGLAATRPKHIRRVAVLNGVYRRSPQAAAAVQARAAAMQGGEFDTEEPLRRWFGEEEREGEAFRLTHGWLARNNPQGYATAYSAFAHGDAVYADSWPRIAAPALFLTGSDDPNSTARMAEQMAAAAPNGRAHIVRGHRHMVNLTAPHEVNAAMLEWLERPEASP